MVTKYEFEENQEIDVTKREPPTFPMGYKTVSIICVVSLISLFSSSLFSHHFRYDVKTRMVRIKSSKALKEKATNSNTSFDSRGIHVGLRDMYSLSSIDHVDVAIFTIRDFRLASLPQRFYCSKWNRSITFRDARFNVSACKDANVVMFTTGKDFSRLEYWRELQAQRKPNQLWLMSTAEAAINTIPTWPPLTLRYIRMNLSSTFRSDSEISIPYGEYIPFQEKLNVPFRSKLLNDSEKLVVWVASHCPLRTWNRTGFVHDLSRYITVDIYGKCGNLRCDDGDRRCFRIFRSYMFYLALENTCCSEYITEKLWNALMKYEAIPIVLGASREEYEKVAPPRSFIHVNDFASVEHLASYLHTVASNLSLYRSYFEWKNHGYIRAHKLYKSVLESQDHACMLFEYANGVRPLSADGFDPFGPSWFASCQPCGTKSWLHEYYFYPFQDLYRRIHSD